MKALSFLLLSILFISCNAQNSFPTDWEIEALNGKPKTIVETSKSYGYVRKDVYYFDRNGLLNKAEHYNMYDSDLDSLFLKDITTYSFLENGTKISVTIDKDKLDTIRLKTYTIVDDQTVSIVTKEYKSEFLAESEQKLNKNNSVKSVKLVVRNTETNEIPVQTTTEYIYDGGKLDKLIILNDTKGMDSKNVTGVNDRYDEFNNYTSRKYVDEHGEVLHTLEREYVYY